MTRHPLLRTSERWFHILQRFYPPDFRDEMGDALVDAYMDRAADALEQGGTTRVVALWLRAFADSLRNGVAERIRPAASWRRAGNWGRDVELVRRRVMRSPVFAVTTIGTLTIGLGMFAVVYTAVQRVLIDPMPYTAPGDLYYVWRDYGPLADVSRGGLAGTDIVELQKGSAVIEGAAGLQPMLGGIFSLGEDAMAMEIAVTQVSPHLFELLGVAPALGRGFTPEEAGRGRSQVIVLTHHLWNRLGANPDVIGTSVRLQGRVHTVVGVMPRDFTFVRNEPTAPPQRVDAYIPFEVDLATTSPTNSTYSAIIRGRRGALPEAVADAVGAVGRAVDTRDFGGRGLRLYPVGLKADVVSRIAPALVALGIAGVVLVLMLMVNLASVLFARAAEREHEVTVSRAMGANTSAVVRSMLVEGSLLGIVGGMLGTITAIWGTRALVALAPLDLPRRDEIAIDWRVAAAVIAIGGLLGLVAAAAPAVWAARTSLATLLAGSAVRGGGRPGRWRRGMVVVQVALSLVLLASGGLVVRSLEHLLRTDAGFRPDGLLTARIRTPPEFFPQFADAIAFQDRVLEALASIPGATGASATSALPLTGVSSIQMASAPASPVNTGDPEQDQVLTDLVAVRAHYPEVMGMRIAAGRTLSPSLQQSVTEALVDETLARRFFPDGNAIGATIQLRQRPFTIVGVVGHARLHDLHADGRPQILVRSEAFGIRPLFYVVRASRDPDLLLRDVQTAVARLDPRVPVGDVRTMDSIVEQARSPQSIGAALIGAFAIGALLLAAMGLFGVVAGSVTRRRHELAVRLALGADRGHVLRLVMKEGTWLVVVGLLVGAPGVFATSRAIRSLLIGISPFDPLTLSAAACGLLIAALATCYIPARRAFAIDPARLLRQE